MKKLLCICLLLAGCATFQKQQKAAEAFYTQYPNELAKLCAANYPPQDRLVTGHDTVTHVDTVTTPGPVITCPPGAIVNCPGSKNVYRDRIVVDTLYQVDAAKVNVLTLQNNTLGQTNESLTNSLGTETKQSATRLFIILALAIVLAASIIVNVKLLFF
jgi:hypothetical protein